MLLDTPDRCRARMEDSLNGYLNELSLAVERREAVRGQESLLLPLEDALERVNGCDMISMQEFLRGMAGFKQGHLTRISALSAPQYHGAVRDLASDIGAWRKKDGEVWLLSGGEARGERLLDTLKGVQAQLDAGVHLAPHTLSRGFVWDEIGLYVIGDTDIYGTGYRKTRARKNSGQRIEAFTDLKEGDYVVHEMHGVGVYMGVTRIQTEGAWRDYLLIQYRGSGYLVEENQGFISAIIDAIEKTIKTGTKLLLLKHSP